MQNLHGQLQELTERIWFLWAHIFSSAIVLGSIVTRCPSMSLAPSALIQLDAACDLFEKSADCFGAQKVLTIMLRLQKRAHVSLSEYQRGVSSPVSRRGSRSSSDFPTLLHENDELATLGGKTRLVEKTEPAATPPLQPFESPVIPLPLSRTTEPQVHSSVVEYLRTFVPTPDLQSMAGPSSTHRLSDSLASNTAPDTYSMLSMTGPFTSDTNLFQHPQHISESESKSQSPCSETLSMDFGSLPRYFPVYDYGPPDDNNVNIYRPDVTMTSPMVPPNHVGRNSLVPETNMHTTWNEFVMGLGMAN